MNEEEVYRKAIKHWGKDLQLIMIIEEMSELQKEICKYFRNKKDINNISLEMADVEIMLGQLKILFDNHNLVNGYKNQQLNKLKRMLHNKGV